MVAIDRIFAGSAPPIQGPPCSQNRAPKPTCDSQAPTCSFEALADTLTSSLASYLSWQAKLLSEGGMEKGSEGRRGKDQGEKEGQVKVLNSILRTILVKKTVRKQQMKPSILHMLNKNLIIELGTYPSFFFCIVFIELHIFFLHFPPFSPPLYPLP